MNNWYVGFDIFGGGMLCMLLYLYGTSDAEDKGILCFYFVI
ncbi:hypothetical protein T09_13535 [Trichinella sp. T9]|nr:hypothetical protein T09_13535 [Trichinella sp. T9]